MIESSKKKTYSCDFEIKSFVDNSGKEHTISEEEIQKLINNLKEKIQKSNEYNGQEYINANIIYAFDNFKVDEKVLKNYDEKNVENYRHFVYEFLRKYYREIKISNEWSLHENVYSTPYDKLSLLHIKMCEKSEEDPSRYMVWNVKELIINEIQQFIVRPNKSKLNLSKESFSEFLSFVIESKMFQFDEEIKLDYNFHGLSSYFTVKAI